MTIRKIPLAPPLEDWSLTEYLDGPCSLRVSCDDLGHYSYFFEDADMAALSAMIAPSPKAPKHVTICLSISGLLIGLGRARKIGEEIDRVVQFFRDCEKAGAIIINGGTQG